MHFLTKRDLDLRGNIINGFVFIHIPKCGGNSVVGNCFHNDMNKWANWYRWRGYDKFITTVRNPYTRWESIWAHMTRAELVKVGFDDFTKKTLGALILGRLGIAGLFTEHPTEKQLKLGKFLYKHQWQYLQPEEVEVHKMEEETIFERVGIPKCVKNVGYYERPKWTSESREMFQKWFAKDFELFDYDIKAF